VVAEANKKKTCSYVGLSARLSNKLAAEMLGRRRTAWRKEAQHAPA